MPDSVGLLKKIEIIFEKYERHISSFALIAGFIFDTLTLRSIDLLFENLTIFSYLVMSGGSILLLNYFEEKRPEKSFSTRLHNILPFLIQFAFGALFSAFFIFYTRSATLTSSWPFILILLGLLIGNEFFKNYYQKLVFQVSIFFLAVFSFSIFFVPVILKVMGAFVFLLSGGVSLVVISLFSRLIFRVVPKRFKDSQNDLKKAVLTIFVFINILYFLNLIPPIPLAMKDSGVYYSVEKIGEDYRVIGERKRWYESLPFLFAETISLKSGAPLYAFSSIFAPAELDTTVVHDWQYFDEEKSRWVSTTKIPFAIRGGRKEGYRGFSKKENLFDGRWRVDVETERGQIIGRVRFNIKISPEAVALREETL